MHTNDLHATLLALMGLDHEQLTYRYAGRDFRLTDVAGNVAEDLRLNEPGPGHSPSLDALHTLRSWRASGIT